MNREWNNKYVCAVWNDEFPEEFVGYVGDNLSELKTQFEAGLPRNITKSNMILDFPFYCEQKGDAFRLCYYDPYEKFKKALDEGKQVQCSYEPDVWIKWDDSCKPLEQFDVSALRIVDDQTPDPTATKVKIGSVWRHCATNTMSMVVAIRNDGKIALGTGGVFEPNELFNEWSEVIE